MHHLPVHEVRATQQSGGTLHVPHIQQFTDTRRRAPGAVIRHEIINHHNLKPVLFAQLTHGVKVTRVAVPETHIIANHHVTGVQGIHKNALHKLFGALLRELQVVVKQHIILQAQLTHKIAA